LTEVSQSLGAERHNEKSFDENLWN